MTSKSVEKDEPHADKRGVFVWSQCEQMSAESPDEQSMTFRPVEAHAVNHRFTFC